MASWKKIIVSGGDISQLNNDSGYLTSTGTIATASVATRANGLADTVTASQADDATTASFAATGDGIFSGSFSGSFQGQLDATIASASIADTAGTASVALRANSLAPTVTATSASVAARATTLSPAATASFADLASDARTATSASVATTAQTASVAGRANALAPTVTATSASVAARATTLSAAATASFADLASDARTATSASIAALASTLSATATASIADTATSASRAASGDGLFSGSFSGSFQGDGSDLTGLATTLTVDGDSGAEDVSLTADDLQILGTTNEIVTAVTKDGTNVKATLSLPDDVTIGQDLTVTRDAVVTRNLTVQGTASFQATTDLDVADRFIRLASGSNTAGEGGFVVQQGSNGFGEVFGYDQTTLRFGLTSSFDATQNAFAPDAFFSNVIEGAANDPTATISKYTKKGNIFVANNGDIHIYS